MRILIAAAVLAFATPVMAQVEVNAAAVGTYQEASNDVVSLNSGGIQVELAYYRALGPVEIGVVGDIAWSRGTSFYTSPVTNPTQVPVDIGVRLDNTTYSGGVRVRHVGSFATPSARAMIGLNHSDQRVFINDPAYFHESDTAINSRAITVGGALDMAVLSVTVRASLDYVFLNSAAYSDLVRAGVGITYGF